jgi:hypothetical protein
MVEAPGLDAPTISHGTLYSYLQNFLYCPMHT